MEQVKSRGKLQGFSRAILDAANLRADELLAEADERERSTLEDYKANARARSAQRVAAAKSEIAAREEKRVMTETMAARRSVLALRGECAAQVMDEVRERLRHYPETAEYTDTLCALLKKGLAVCPGAKSARVLLRREDIDRVDALARCAGDVKLEFAGAFISLGGLIIEFPEERRRVDLSFDTSLEDLSGRFAELVGFGMEVSDGQ